MSQNTILNKDGYLVTIDIILAATLVSKEHPVVTCKEIGQGNYMYTFKKNQSALRLVSLFEKRRMRVKPYWFYQALESIHKEFHSGGHYDN